MEGTNIYVVEAGQTSEQASMHLGTYARVDDTQVLDYTFICSQKFVNS